MPEPDSSTGRVLAPPAGGLTASTAITLGPTFFATASKRSLNRVSSAADVPAGPCCWAAAGAIQWEEITVAAVPPRKAQDPNIKTSANRLISGASHKNGIQKIGPTGQESERAGSFRLPKSLFHKPRSLSPHLRGRRATRSHCLCPQTPTHKL